MRAMSLTAEESESEQNDLRNLQAELDSFKDLAQMLIKKLNDLEEQVSNTNCVIIVRRLHATIFTKTR